MIGAGNPKTRLKMLRPIVFLKIVKKFGVLKSLTKLSKPTHSLPSIPFPIE